MPCGWEGAPRSVCQNPPVTSASPSLLRPPLPGKLTRRLGATTLTAQALVVFLGTLVAWRLGAASGDPRSTAYLWVGGALTLLCVVAAGALRSRAGIVLGWLCQALTLVSALVLPAMAVVGVIFGLLWWVCLSQGRRLDALSAEREG